MSEPATMPRSLEEHLIEVLDALGPRLPKVAVLVRRAFYVGALCASELMVSEGRAALLQDIAAYIAEERP